MTSGVERVSRVHVRVLRVEALEAFGEKLVQRRRGALFPETPRGANARRPVHHASFLAREPGQVEVLYT